MNEPSTVPSILYQRGLYPIDDFNMTTRYGMKVLVSTNPELTAYINSIIKQLQGIHRPVYYFTCDAYKVKNNRMVKIKYDQQACYCNQIKRDIGSIREMEL